MSSAATRSLPEDSDAPPAKRANTSSTAELESAKVEAPVKNNPSELSGGGEGDRVERKSGSTEKRSDSQTQTIAEPSDVFGVTAATHSHALDTPFIPKSESASNFNGGSISRAQTNRAKTQVSHEDESTSLIDCGIIQNGQRVYHVHEPYFGQTVEVFTAREDPHQRILFRPSLVAKKLNCHTSRVGMFLNRKKKDLNGIYQASGFAFKPNKTIGLKTGAYFISIEVCKKIEEHLKGPTIFEETSPLPFYTMGTDNYPYRIPQASAHHMAPISGHHIPPPHHHQGFSMGRYSAHGAPIPAVGLPRSSSFGFGSMGISEELASMYGQMPMARAQSYTPNTSVSSAMTSISSTAGLPSDSAIGVNSDAHVASLTELSGSAASTIDSSLNAPDPSQNVGNSQYFQYIYQP